MEQHNSWDCPHRTHKCKVCNKVGHIESACYHARKGNPPRQNVRPTGRARGRGRGGTRRGRGVASIYVHGVDEDYEFSNKIFIDMKINGRQVTMRLDTGSDITLIGVKEWQRLGKPELQAPKIELRAANQNTLDCKGHFNCIFEIEGRTLEGRCYVVSHPIKLLGCDVLAKHPEMWNRLHGKVDVEAVQILPVKEVKEEAQKLTEELKTSFPDVFADGLGRCTKAKASLKLQEEAGPVFRKSRPVPYASIPKLEKELDRLVDMGVLSPVTHSDFAAPIVIVKKKSGEIRLCADYSSGLNDALQDYHHPLPTPEDIFSKLNGGVYFSNIDLAEAYLQMEVEEDSKKYLTINTQKAYSSTTDCHLESRSLQQSSSNLWT